jgi:TonB family protein
MKPALLSVEPIDQLDPRDAPVPALLVILEPWHRVFLHNFADLLRPRQDLSLELVSRPGSFWPDVFVASHVPWNRFAQSALCHLAVIAALWGAARLWPDRPRALQSPTFNRADVLYYAPAEYLPPLDTGGARRLLPERADPEYAPQPIISVPPEADNRTQTIVTPSELKLDHEVRLPNIVAWSQPQPAVPLASTANAANLRIPQLPVAAIAPAPETIPANRQRTSSLSTAVVAPAPDLNAQSSTRALQAPQAAVIAPPPRVNTPAGRRLGDVNIGHAAVVAPAPELPLAEQYALAGGRGQTGLGTVGPTVVPPAPSIPGSAGSHSGGRLIALGIHPAAQGPAEMPMGNRRGTFAATPSGKSGASATPDVAANASSDNGNGSGSARNRDGLPPGLSVGAAPDNQSGSAIAGPTQGSGEGNGQGNGIGKGGPSPGGSDGSRLIADATPPRVSATPPRPAPEVSQDKATDVDHWIFGDRKFYSMTLNMPNLNSAGGSWVIRFAELNGNETKGELTAPVATQKVDPAYPLELMRRNVQGTVTLYAIIRNDGSVSDVRVLRGVDDRLDQYARAALAHWRFRPATRNGNAVDLEAVVLIPFKPVGLKSGF